MYTLVKLAVKHCKKHKKPIDRTRRNENKNNFLVTNVFYFGKKIKKFSFTNELFGLRNRYLFEHQDMESRNAKAGDVTDALKNTLRDLNKISETQKKAKNKKICKIRKQKKFKKAKNN